MYKNLSFAFEGGKTARFLIAYSLLTLLILLACQNFILNLLGSNFEATVSVYPIGSFMTGNGVFDDFYNSVNLAFTLPDPNRAYVLTPLLIAFSRVAQISPLLFHFLFIAVSLCIWVLSFKNLEFPKAIYIPLLLTYPILFAISRSNPILPASACIFAAFSYIYGRKPKINLGIIFAGLSVSIHPGCALLILAIPFKLLIKKYYIFIFISSLNMILIYILSDERIYLFFRNYYHTLRLYSEAYIFGAGGTLFNNSLYGILKLYILSFELPLKGYVLKLASLNKIYSYLSTLVLFICTIYAIFSRNYIKKILILTLVSIFIPHISADYKLEFLIISIAFLIYCINFNGKINKNESLILLLLFVIIFPKHYIFFRIYSNFGEFFSIQSIINPILILITLIISIFSDLKIYSKKIRL